MGYQTGRLRRITKEIQDLERGYAQQIRIFSIDQSKQSGIIQFCGGLGTPYEGYWFKLLVQWPKHYPFSPLKVKFLSKIWNPYVDYKTGEICLDILHDMHSPALTVCSVILSVCVLIGLTKLDNYQFVNPQAAQQMVNNPQQFFSNARKLCIEQKLPYKTIYDNGRMKFNDYENQNKQIKQKNKDIQNIIFAKKEVYSAQKDQKRNDKKLIQQQERPQQSFKNIGYEYSIINILKRLIFYD